jgi:hypothetical protein
MAPTVPVCLILLSSCQAPLSLNLQGSSDLERLAAHSEVLALQQRLGISYKDAAHRLYMAELERVKADKEMYMASKTMKDSIEKSLTMAFNSINSIHNPDGGAQ